jgi:LmbE family N-acetylglucosaminyl deacetylase
MAFPNGTAAGRASGRLFVSPHLDDVAFGCGELVASSARPVVVTLFAGRPPRAAPITRWDADCGFDEGDDVVGARRDEDRCALDVLGATPYWLDFLDDQYGASPTGRELADAIAAVLEREQPRSIFVPLGLFHADHRRASDAALALADRRNALRWYAYDDALYRRIDGAVDARIGELAQRGFDVSARRFDVAADANARKRRAIACYRSQLAGLASRAGHDDLFGPETYRSIDAR